MPADSQTVTLKRHRFDLLWICSAKYVGYTNSQQFHNSGATDTPAPLGALGRITGFNQYHATKSLTRVQHGSDAAAVTPRLHKDHYRKT